MQQLAGGSPAHLVVRDDDQVRVLLDRDYRLVLGAFMGEARSITDAARELAVEAEWLRRRVERLCRERLVRVARTVPRAGRSIRHYRAVADDFFVPIEAVTFDSLYAGVDRRFSAFRGAILSVAASELARLPQVGLRIARKGPAGVRIEVAPEPGRWWEPQRADGPAAMESWSDLRLERDEALALQRDLRAVITAYTGRQSPAGEPHILGVLLAPSGSE
ncbi:MAG: hypothetical protein ACRCSN_03425 [Dermatophilaceae bacterium]